MDVFELLQKWWDFMDEGNTHTRKEYTEEEQINIISDFVYENIIEKN
jgi:hypothetical protein